MTSGPRKPVVLQLGGTNADHHPGETVRVFFDPVGQSFCCCISRRRVFTLLPDAGVHPSAVGQALLISQAGVARCSSSEEIAGPGAAGVAGEGDLDVVDQPIDS